jgi:hypothetical protein
VHRWFLRCAASGLHDANITVDPGRPSAATGATADLLELLAADFRAHRLSSGRRAGLVIARADAAPWRKHDWDNWRERVWQPLAVHAGLG